MNQIILLFFAVLLLVSDTACAGKHESPPHKMIDIGYFKCESSRSIEGGIYGKGPFKRFGPEKSSCSASEWIPVTQEEFKLLATEWYGYDWGKEIPFWNQKK